MFKSKIASSVEYSNKKQTISINTADRNADHKSFNSKDNQPTVIFIRKSSIFGYPFRQLRKGTQKANTRKADKRTICQQKLHS